MKKQKGKIIRIDHEIESILNNKRQRNESYSSVIRRVFGLPVSRVRNLPITHFLHHFFVVISDGNPVAFTDEALAKGFSIQVGIRMGLKKPVKIIEVWERA